MSVRRQRVKRERERERESQYVERGSTVSTLQAATDVMVRGS